MEIALANHSYQTLKHTSEITATIEFGNHPQLQRIVKKFEWDGDNEDTLTPFETDEEFIRLEVNEQLAILKQEYLDEALQTLSPEE